MSTLDGKLTKVPHSKTDYDTQQLIDFAKCADPKTGPLYFLTHFFNIQHPKQGRLLYKPYDFQLELIDSYVNNRFSVNLLSRQLGKCFLYSTEINCINKSNNKTEKMQIGDLLWNEMTLKQKIVTKLELWLVKLAK